MNHDLETPPESRPCGGSKDAPPELQCRAAEAEDRVVGAEGNAAVLVMKRDVCRELMQKKMTWEMKWPTTSR